MSLSCRNQITIIIYTPTYIVIIESIRFNKKRSNEIRLRLCQNKFDRFSFFNTIILSNEFNG